MDFTKISAAELAAIIVKETMETGFSVTLQDWNFWLNAKMSNQNISLGLTPEELETVENWLK